MEVGSGDREIPGRTATLGGPTEPAGTGPLGTSRQIGSAGLLAISSEGGRIPSAF